MKTVSCALRNRPHAQRGLTLLVALVVLAALGLLAAWGLKAGGANMRVVGNMQARQQALSAAQSALESTISSAQFSQQPATVAAQPIAVDIDGDGVADITARLSPAPACYRVRIVSLSELDAASAADRPCLRSNAMNSAGIENSTVSSADSLCADSEWNVRAVASDATTGALVSINQGVSLRGLVTDTSNGCP